MFGLALTVVLFGSTFAATTVEMLAADSRFKTLVNFVTQAGLVDTLNAGTFTIFAPTDAAFAKLPAATVQALTADPALLTDVLTYHVTSGSVMSAAAKDEMLVTMVNGGQARFNIYSHNNVVTIQGSTITEFDKVASNGVIHVIDTVMTQPKQSIVDIVAGNSDFSTLLRLVKAANLTNALLADGLTVFAPNNAAFARIPAAELTNLENDAAMLASVLTYHVVGSTEFSTGLYKQELLTTLNGDTVRVHFTHHGADVKINNGLVLSADIQATNGVVHVIDHVLLPGGVVVGRR